MNQQPKTGQSHRIAFVSGGIGFGGSTAFLVNFAGELIRRNMPVEVLSFERENPMSADFEKQNIPVLCLDQRRMIFEDRLKVILRRLTDFRPTVVVSTLGSVSFEVLRYLPPGVFRVGMAQSDDPKVYNMMDHYTPWMDLAVMVSQTMKEKVSDMPEFARVPVAYLPYGVPMCPDGELPARDFSAPLRILYLGRLEREQKRVQLFPEILSQFCASGMPFHWTIAGEGNERGFLEANLKTDSPRQTVSFAGPVRYADVPAVLKQHDVFLLASDYEGLPLSLLEAMGHGLVPVVSYLASGIPEVVDETTGFLVPVEDVTGYGRAIVHLHQHRDEMAAKSAAACKRVRAVFSITAMTDRWLTALSQHSALIGDWPQRWRVQAPIMAGGKIHFSPLARQFRRMGRWLQTFRK